MHKLFIFFMSFYFAFNSPLLANQVDSFDELVIKGKNLIEEGVRKWDDKILLQARSLFERLEQNQEMKWLVNYYIGYADYRLVIYYQTQNKTDLQIKYLDDAIDNIQASLDEREKFADAHALLSSLLGQKISIDPASAMKLGIEAGIAIRDAMKYGKKNPRVWLFSAISAYFTPEQYGGSKSRALEEMQHSVGLFKDEKLPDPRLPDWGYSEAWTWLGKFNLEAGKLESAKQNLEAALKIDPENGFAKIVQSELKKKMTEK
ncbi:MAG: hypothetical protein ACE5HI_15770 [bacterium]